MHLLTNFRGKKAGWLFSKGIAAVVASLIVVVVLATPVPVGQAEGPSQAGDEILHRAEADFGNGRIDQALEECRKAIELSPRSAEAYYLLGVIQDRRDLAAEARQALERSVELDPARVDVHIYLGELYLHLKQFDPAAMEFQSAIKLGDDDFAEGRFGLALALVRKSQYKEALPYLSAAIEASPGDLQRLATLIEAEVELNRLDDARAHLKQIETLPPESPEISYNLGELLLKHSLSAEAEGELTRAARLLETRTGPVPLGINPAALYMELAKLRFQRKDYWEALGDLANVPLATLPAKQQAEVRRFRAGALLGAGNPAEALHEIREAARLSPANDADLMQQAWAELLAGDQKAARETMRSVASKFPGSPDVRDTAAMIQREELPPRSAVPITGNWHLKGEGFVCCPCKTPCPCRSNAQPSEGHCETAAAFRIDHGHYGKVGMDGFVYVILNGAMDKLGTPLTLFVDRTARDEQVIALERIYQAFMPLRIFMFHTVERAPISFTHSPEDHLYAVEIPGRIQLKIQRQLDEQGRPLMQTAAVDYLSNTLEYAQNLVDKVWDAGGALQWDYSRHQANWRFIDLDARDYQQGRMLAQFQDYSGFFTPKQLELIKALNLPMLPSYPGSGKP